MAVCVAGMLGCRAQVAMPDAGTPDQGVGDASVPGDGPVDLAGVDQTCAGPIVPEICNNGCDDDHNGYTDDDDPACTPQLLVTYQAGSPTLDRLLLSPVPKTRVLDGNPLGGGWFADYQRAFAPAVFLARESSPGTIRRLVLVPDGGVGAVSDFHPNPGYSARDACVFNGELIVVERAASSLLHRFQSDGKSEIGTVPLGANLLATACASDGKLLYVAAHDTTGDPSQFLVFDSTFSQVATLALPAALLGQSLDRCLDFAWAGKFGFYGLFASSGGSLSDATLSAGQLTPFAFDGGVGAPIDAGTIHGVGEFLP